MLLAAVLSSTAFGCKKPQGRPTPPPPVVTVILPGSASVQRYYEYNGYLDAVEMVMIQARVEGILNEVLFVEGKEVKKGDKLYSIDPREYTAGVARSKADIAKSEADIINGRAQVLIAEAEVARLKSASSAVSKSDIDKSEATAASNRGLLGAALANKDSGYASLKIAELKLSYTDIRAPIAGRISRTLVTPGNLVGQKDATLLTTIVSIDPIYVYFDVPERDLIEYEKRLNDPTTAAKMAPRGKSPVEIGVATEDGFPHPGEIDFRENRVETGTGTVRLRGIISNTTQNGLLYAGLYAKVRIPRGMKEELVVIPEEALMTGQEGTYVYVVKENNEVEKRVVTTLPQAVWRAGPAGSKKPPEWKLLASGPRPTPPTPPEAKDAPAAKGPPPKDAPPMPTEAAVRSIVAVEKGLSKDDRVIVLGLQKARAGASVAPDMWELKGPPPEAK